MDKLKGYWNKDDDLQMNLNRIEMDVKEWRKCNVNHVLGLKKELMAKLNGIQKSIRGN